MRKNRMRRVLPGQMIKYDAWCMRKAISSPPLGS